MGEVLEILKKAQAELKKELEAYPPDYGTMEYGRTEVREQWLAWLEHLIFLMER